MSGERRETVSHQATLDCFRSRMGWGAVPDELSELRILGAKTENSEASKNVKGNDPPRREMGVPLPHAEPDQRQGSVLAQDNVRPKESVDALRERNPQNASKHRERHGP